LAGELPLKEHFDKALVKSGEVGVAFTAEKPDFAEYLRFVAILGKAAVIVLHVMGSEDDPIGNLHKVTVIAAIGAGESHAGFGRKGGAGFRIYRSIHSFPPLKIHFILRQAA
jgi:hypothetical protein